MEIYRMLTGLGIPSCLSPGTSPSTLLVVAHFLIHLHDQLPTISGRVFGRSQALINDRLRICNGGWERVLPGCTTRSFPIGLNTTLGAPI